jgi:anti-sigma factor (TIGR02949 family)
MIDDPHTDPLPEMPCQDLVEVVTAYLDGALGDVDRQRFEAHLEVCDECVAYVEQIRVTIAATARTDAHPEALSAELREGIRSAFRDWSS